MDNNTEFTIYLTGTTNGGSYNSKILSFKFSTMQTNLLTMITQTTEQLADLRKKQEEAERLAELERLKPKVVEIEEPDMPPE